MGCTLHDSAVAAVLARLRAHADAEDAPAKVHVQARERELGHKIYGRERVDAYGGAPLAISEEVAKLVYVLAVARRPRTVVEFGASLGYSTIHLAAALRDAGGGRLITTELSADKAGTAAVNIAQAGLDDVVELRVGDALDTLASLDADVDFLFLDGSNDLYRGVLELLAPRLAPGALVVADLSKGDPELERYRAQMLDPGSGYVSVQVPLDDGVLISTPGA
ncbi:MAG TPA: class I SAM-dependent methyltransferase [Solirubrobacteraceae bacterium]|nr:class I SAM-dependent methyltransferase [Solirubrobacteraceae bacterium]